ncbi:MAG: hypothetical protein NVSMB25_17010 [Thermoleophilaceae bacterium]
MKILVTGGSGFIGSHVLDVLGARGHSPRNFDRVPSPHHPSGAIDTVLGELTDTDALAQAMEGCDAVVHLAAMADVNDVQADPEGAQMVNCRGTLAVLEAARRSGIGRVVYGSTIWVYSDVEETAVTEHTRLVPPGHLYTATKLAGELYCRSYAELWGIDYTILRFGIPYGPRARPAAVVPMFVNKALNGEALTVAGSGDQSRRFVYVEDLADGIVRGLEPHAANRVYNLAGTETVTILEIAETVKDLVGTTEIVHTPARAGDFGGKDVSSERALAELGWRASTPFAEGVRRYVAWRKESDAPIAASSSEETVRSPDQPLASPLGRIARGLRKPRMRPAMAALTVAAAFFWSFATDETFTVLANIFRARPQTSVHTSRPEVGLLVKAPADVAPAVASELASHGARASFALDGATGSATVLAIRGVGSDAVPQLRSAGLVRWLGTGAQLRHTARSLGVSGHVYYAPPRGFTFGQDVLGHTAGATPVAGAVSVHDTSQRVTLRRGAVVELSIRSSAGNWRPVVRHLVGSLRAGGLRGVPADSLLRASRRSR